MVLGPKEYLYLSSGGKHIQQIKHLQISKNQEKKETSKKSLTICVANWGFSLTTCKFTCFNFMMTNINIIFLLRLCTLSLIK